MDKQKKLFNLRLKEHERKNLRLSDEQCYQCCRLADGLHLLYIPEHFVLVMQNISLPSEKKNGPFKSGIHKCLLKGLKRRYQFQRLATDHN